MKTVVKFLLIVGIATGIATSACSDEPKESGRSEAWRRGRAVYIANCTACHNRDPSRDGPLGPAILGSSKELLEALLLRGEYPPNYKPKRPTKTMPTFPFLEPEIPYLAAYLASDFVPKSR